MKNKKRAKGTPHQADNLAKLRNEFLSLLEPIAQILCAVSGKIILLGSWQYAHLRVAIAFATIILRVSPLLQIRLKRSW